MSLRVVLSLQFHFFILLGVSRPRPRSFVECAVNLSFDFLRFAASLSLKIAECPCKQSRSSYIASS